MLPEMIFFFNFKFPTECAELYNSVFIVAYCWIECSAATGTCMSQNFNGSCCFVALAGNNKREKKKKRMHPGQMILCGVETATATWNIVCVCVFAWPKNTVRCLFVGRVCRTSLADVLFCCVFFFLLCHKWNWCIIEAEAAPIIPMKVKTV